MEDITVNPVPLSNPDIEMNESTVHPHLNNDIEGPDINDNYDPDTEEDEYLGVIEGYLVPTDDVEMDSHETGNFRASDIQLEDPRNDEGSTSRPKSIMPATQQNTAASAESAVRFRPNSDSPLFEAGRKRRMEGDEEYKKQNEKRVHVRAIQLRDEFVC